MAEPKVGEQAPGFTLKSTSGGHGDYSKFESKDTVVLPISVDSTPTHNEFRNKHKMTHHLLSDFKREAGRAYGVLDEEKFFTRRAYFLVDKGAR